MYCWIRVGLPHQHQHPPPKKKVSFKIVATRMEAGKGASLGRYNKTFIVQCQKSSRSNDTQKHASSSKNRSKPYMGRQGQDDMKTWSTTRETGTLDAIIIDHEWLIGHRKSSSSWEVSMLLLWFSSHCLRRAEGIPLL